MADDQLPEPKSPCISVCVLDEEDICQGCWRSAREITDWMTLNGDGKRAVLKKASERFQASDKSGLL